jgi:hypothetical protein
MLDPQEHGPQQDLDSPVPILDPHLLDRADRADQTGIVEHDVQPPRHNAEPRPIPLAEPVIIATFPSSLPIDVSSLSRYAAPRLA